MILYCVEEPWWELDVPENWPDKYRWFGSFREAKKYANKTASSMEWGTDLTTVFAGGHHRRAVVVTKEILPELSPKKLLLWMSANACRPCGEVWYMVVGSEPSSDDEDE